MCLKMKDPVNRLNKSCEYPGDDSCLVRNTPGFQILILPYHILDPSNHTHKPLEYHCFVWTKIPLATCVDSILEFNSLEQPASNWQIES